MPACDRSASTTSLVTHASAIALAALVLADMATAASAGAGHHRHSIHHPMRSVSRSAPSEGGSAEWPTAASLVAGAARRANAEPGVTLELAPDAKESATGGPAGGVPGYDGS